MPDEPESKALNPTPLINRNAIREACFDLAKTLRPEMARRWNRVGEQVYQDAQQAIRQMLTARIRAHPSAGKTIT